MAENLYEDILEELESIPTIDAHEHLMSEEAYLKEPVDFYTLFSGYCQGDLLSAGATQEDLDFWADRKQPLEARWRRFRPWLAAIRTGSYARAAFIVIRDLLGFEDLTDETYKPISEKLASLSRPGLYDEILRKRCNIVACIRCWTYGQKGQDYFYELASAHELMDLFSASHIRKLAEDCNHPVHSLDDLIACVHIKVKQWKGGGAVGIKCAHAYSRPIDFQNASALDAEAALKLALKERSHMISLPEVKPLQDFVMYRLCAAAEEAGLPMVFHTGLQAGIENRIANANPLLLQDLLEEFPRLPVDIFHGGLPFASEAGILAKHFPGVHINMAWMHLISPTIARRGLSEWLEMVPNTKIFGFGGDYQPPKVYGHLKIARENIAAVLAEKVAQGVYSRAEASRIAWNLMFDNPNRFYNLGLKGKS